MLLVQARLQNLSSYTHLVTGFDRDRRVPITSRGRSLPRGEGSRRTTVCGWGTSKFVFPFLTSRLSIQDTVFFPKTWNLQSYVSKKELFL